MTLCKDYPRWRTTISLTVQPLPAQINNRLQNKELNTIKIWFLSNTINNHQNRFWGYPKIKIRIAKTFSQMFYLMKSLWCVLRQCKVPLFSNLRIKRKIEGYCKAGYLNQNLVRILLLGQPDSGDSEMSEWWLPMTFYQVPSWNKSYKNSARVKIQPKDA